MALPGFLGGSIIFSDRAEAKRNGKPRRNHGAKNRNRREGDNRDAARRSRSHKSKNNRTDANESKSDKDNHASVAAVACKGVGSPCGKWSDCCSGSCEANGKCTKTKGKGKNKKKVPSGNCRCAARGCPPSTTTCGTTCCDAGSVCLDDRQSLCIPGSIKVCKVGDKQCQNDTECDIEYGEICCGGRCANPTCDANNCEGCERSCAAGQECLFGMCWTYGSPCPLTTHECGSACCGRDQQCSNGVCNYPADWDLVLTTVCEGSKPAQCSLQYVLKPTDLFACGAEIATFGVKKMLVALRLPKVKKALEAIDFASNIVDLTRASTVFKAILAGLELIPGGGCAIAIANILTGGQYDMLKRCLADELCSREITKSILGTDDPCFDVDCSHLDDECNFRVCEDGGVCSGPNPKANGTSCGNGGRICQAGTCCTPNCSGKQCGTDGCNGSCGSCTGGKTCQSGQCVCAPDNTTACSGKQCGTAVNNCGSTVSCGNCGGGQTCQNGQCVTACKTPGQTCQEDNQCCSPYAGLNMSCTDGLCKQRCGSDEYLAEYWNNESLSGSPSLVRCERWPIDQNWGTGSPGPGIPADRFSARWTGRANFAAGSYDFIARGDDGIKVWLDGNLIIDQWTGALPEKRVTLGVSGGEHRIKVEFREYAWDAVAKFRWESSSCLSSQYKAEYWSNESLSGSPAVVLCENWPIYHEWGQGSPAAGVPADNFSARWTGRANFQAGEYKFTAFADDRIRVYLDNQLVVNQWDQSSGVPAVTRFVSAGMHDIRVEYREFYVFATAQFRWDLIPGCGSNPACPSGQTCVSGTCVCPNGFVPSGSQCVCPNPRITCNGICCVALETCVANVCTLPPSCNKPLNRDMAPRGTGMAGTTQCYSGTQCHQTISINLTGAPANTGYDVYIDWDSIGSVASHKPAGIFTTDGSGNAVFQNTIHVTAARCPNTVDNEIVLRATDVGSHQFIQEGFTPCAYCP